jgi:DNA (cytosine-5)-methyltransferase 1
MSFPLHPDPVTEPVACGDSLDGVVTPEDQMRMLIEAGRKYKSYRLWDRIRIGRSQQDITGNGFNAIRFDPKKPAHTIRRMDSNLGMGGAMHWAERRRFSLQEFKRFASFPDGFDFPDRFENGIKQIGNCVPPLFMRAIAKHIRTAILGKKGEYEGQGPSEISRPGRSCEGKLA